MKILFVVLLSLFVSTQAYAMGVVGNAKVIQIRIDQDGKGMVVFDQQLSNTPAPCGNSNYSNALAFNLNSGGGKGILAMAMAARADGSRITAYGTGACNVYGGAHVEDWSYGVVGQ